LTAPAVSRRAFFGAAGAFAAATGAQARSFVDQTTVVVDARVIPHFRLGGATETRFGRCVFRGGLELSSSHSAFGGLSGMAMDADGGGFLALSDRGVWLRADIRYDGARPVGLANCVMAPMLGPDGRPLSGTRLYDTESLCIDNGVAYVGIERAHQVLRFDWARERFAARGRPVPVPPAFGTLPANRGCEGLAVAPPTSPLAGALIALSERSGGRSEPTKGFILTGPRRGEFRYALKDDFDATDIAFLPDGDLLVLERYYRIFRGAGVRIRRIDGATIRPGALLDGPPVLTADMGYQIDNMEALGVHATREGEIVLTLLSDDNFSFLQRTLLLQFVLTGE